MLPVEIAQAKYQTGGENTFEADLACHKKCGHVLSTNDYFMMWRIVWASWSPQKLLDASLADPAGDCAFIWYAGGDLSLAADDALKITPVRFVIYERRNRLKFLDLQRIFRA